MKAKRDARSYHIRVFQSSPMASGVTETDYVAPDRYRGVAELTFDGRLRPFASASLRTIRGSAGINERQLSLLTAFSLLMVSSFKRRSLVRLKWCWLSSQTHGALMNSTSGIATT